MHFTSITSTTQISPSSPILVLCYNTLVISYRLWTQWNFATHSDLSFEITDPKTHLKTWSEIWWTLSKVYSKTSNSNKYLSQALILRNLICQSCLFRLRHFATQYLESLHSKQRENEQILATLCRSQKIWCQYLNNGKCFNTFEYISKASEFFTEYSIEDADSVQKSNTGTA